MAHRIARWILFIAIFLAVPPAFAQTDNPPPTRPAMQGAPRSAAAAQIRAACGHDFLRFCRGVQPGGGRVFKCLMVHRGALSPACGAGLAAVRPGAGAAGIPQPIPPLSAQTPEPLPPGSPPPGNTAPVAPVDRAAFQASCGPDVSLFCAGSSREAIAKCLISHRMELSSACKTFFQEMRAERGVQRNSPSYTPPPPPPAASDVPPPPPPPPSTGEGPPAAGAPSNE
jgi:hypothetical protein